MKVEIKVKQWHRDIGWVHRIITFNKIIQAWQSGDGHVVVELLTVKEG